MRIFRPKYRDKEGNQKEQAVYWLQYSIQGRRTRCSLRTRDRRAAELKAADIIRRAELGEVAGIDNLLAHLDRPIANHLEDFETMLRSGGVSEGHLQDRMSCLRSYVEHNDIRRIRDLDPAPATRWLLALKEEGLAARTVNRRLQALRQFSRWLVRGRRLPHDPFESIAMLRESVDRRRIRRTLARKELATLIQAARERPLAAARSARTRSGVSAKEEARLRRLGETRARLYTLAVMTGLRRKELQTLQWGDVDAQAGVIHLRAAAAKSRTKQDALLRKDLLPLLEQQRNDLQAEGYSAGSQDPVFPSRLFPSARTFQADLRAAGIEPKGEDDRVVDFHSFRKTFTTALTEAGVQALARHSRIDLTMGVYTDLERLDLRGAVESLPATPAADAERGVSLVSATLPLGSHSGAQPRTTTQSRGRRTLSKRRCRKTKRKRVSRALLGVVNGGSDGTRTRDLRLDRPAL